MSVTYVSAEIRRLVVARSEGLCEYCLIAEEDTFYGCAVDHIISEKHGGRTQRTVATGRGRFLAFRGLHLPIAPGR